MKKQSLKAKICHALDLSPEIFPKSSLIELHGDSLVKIQNGGRFLLYTPTEIRLRLRGKRGCLCILGEELSCSSYNRGAVGIEGKILTLSFLEDEK